MNACQEKERYLVYDVEAVRNGFKRFEFRLPQEVKCVSGFYVSVNHIQPLQGELCLRFSEGISSPLLRFQVRAYSGLPKRKIEYLALDEAISPACLLSGFYQDKSGFASITHKIKIYLRVLEVHPLKP
jgi:hypothetical protein